MLTRGLDRPFAPAGTQCRACRRRALVTQAIFKRKGAPAPKEEKASAKRCAGWSTELVYVGGKLPRLPRHTICTCSRSVCRAGASSPP